MNTFEKLLAVCKMQEADEDEKVSGDDFFLLVHSYGRDSDKESAAEFIVRLRKEAITEADQIEKNYPGCKIDLLISPSSDHSIMKTNFTSDKHEQISVHIRSR